jgi:MazG family protein
MKQAQHRSDDLENVANAFVAFCETVAALRHPETGCPWDLQQNHKSLRRFMIEEAYEAADAMGDEDYHEICSELGDVLLQVVLNSHIAAQDSKFSILNVINGINEKMRRRHPHVFGDVSAADVSSVRKNWEVIKANEAKNLSGTSDSGVFAKASRSASPLLRSFEIGKAAGKIDFDWKEPAQVLQQMRAELDELETAIKEFPRDSDEVRSELSDCYFSLVQLTRHLEMDPESVAMDGAKKFVDRFRILEEIAASQGVDVRTAGQAKLEELWKLAKSRELTAE